MFGIGPTELIIIAIVLVMLFGAKKIPELMRGLGSGIKEFKNASNLESDEDKASDSKENKKVSA